MHFTVPIRSGDLSFVLLFRRNVPIDFVHFPILYFLLPTYCYFEYSDALIATFGAFNSFVPLLYLFIQIERLPTILSAQILCLTVK